MTRKELGRGDIDMLITALSVTWEWMEYLSAHPGDPLLFKKNADTLRRIEEMK